MVQQDDTTITALHDTGDRAAAKKQPNTREEFSLKIKTVTVIGFIVMVIRTWGNYPEGMSFAILIMNACVPLLNKIRPQRFGEKKK